MRSILLALALLGLTPLTHAQTVTQIRTYLTRWEGCSYQPVYRPNGEVVIGVGHRLYPGRDHIKAHYTPEEVQSLFYRDYRWAYGAARRFVPDYLSLPMDARLVLFSLAWTVGSTGLTRFVAMHEAVRRHMWDLAGYELANSKRAHQVSLDRAEFEYHLLADLPSDLPVAGSRGRSTHR